MKLCTVEGCTGVHAAKGYCRKHYDAHRRDTPEGAELLRAANRRYFSRPDIKERERLRHIAYREMRKKAAAHEV